jgi:transcriptional regulator with XRE-family HTH domain
VARDLGVHPEALWHWLGQNDAGRRPAGEFRSALETQLRRLREAKGINTQAAGEAIRSSESKIVRLEQGRINFKLRDVADLLTLYGIHDEQDREIFFSLVQQANLPGWVDIQVAG